MPASSDRFMALVQSYLDRTLTEAATIAEKAAVFRQAYGDLADVAAPFLTARFILARRMAAAVFSWPKKVTQWAVSWPSRSMKWLD
jgi:hypothetical protein